MGPSRESVAGTADSLASPKLNTLRVIGRIGRIPPARASRPAALDILAAEWA